MSREPAGDHPPEAVEIEAMMQRALAGVPRWRRARTRRELTGYVEDALTDLLADGVTPREAVAILGRRFGDPDLVAAGFRAVPPPRIARGMQRSAAPLGVAVLGLVVGLALVQVRTSPSTGLLATGDSRGTETMAMHPAPTPDEAQLSLLHVRQVDNLVQGGTASAPGVDYQVATRLGVSRSGTLVLEPSVPAMTPQWLPDGYDPNHGALFLTSSATIQYFADESRGQRSGIVVEVLRPDRSTIFQVKERHVFPVQMGWLTGFYIDGEWEVRGPTDEQPAPAAWRTDRSHSLLFSRDGYLVLVAGPADVIDADGLIRIARSVR